MRSELVSDLIVAHALEAIGRAEEGAAPFHHIRLQRFFPAEVYDAMGRALPGEGAYRPMSGRAREARLANGTPTRTKLHLLAENLHGLPPAQRELWSAVGTALCSAPVRDAFVQRLAPNLERRFGAEFRRVHMYPIPILTRDVAGYRLGVHPDTRHKAVTVQLYLPRDDSIGHVGTVFHRRAPDGRHEVACRMRFLPNTGYAFGVGADTYHSVELVGPEVRTRDSILLTYFVDDTPWQRIGNRSRRAGNFVAGLFRR